MLQRKARYEKREKEYKKIMMELKKEIRAKETLELDPEEVTNVWGDLDGRINTNIDNISVRTTQVLIEQAKDITRFFKSKIKEIRKEFEMEKFKKGEQDRKICDQENALIQELEWIKNISLKIDTENHNLMKNYMKCKEQYEI